MQKNQEGLVWADVAVVGENTNTIKKNSPAPLDASREV
jgi:hypothetical protein